jgi:hypothetical protein
MKIGLGLFLYIFFANFVMLNSDLLNNSNRITVKS